LRSVHETIVIPQGFSGHAACFDRGQPGDRRDFMRSGKLLAMILGLALVGCTGGVSSKKSAVSCYQTANGVVCLSGGAGEDQGVDADGDGQDDPYLCGDAESDSEGDSASTDEDSTSGEDGADDEGGDDEMEARTGGGDGEDSLSDSDGTSDSDSNEQCGETSTSDGDGDGVPDGDDCDCQDPGGGDGGEQPPPPGDPVPPPPPPGDPNVP
jgi:hypothetical protein